MHALLLFQLLVVHPDGAEPVAFDSRRWRAAVSRPASEVAREELAQSKIAIVGAFDENPWFRKLAAGELEDQARAYEVAFAGLADETDWIRGTFWWKWPTDLSRGGADDRGFTPSGKPAEDVCAAGIGLRYNSGPLPNKRAEEKNP